MLAKTEGWSPFNVSWMESRPEGQPGIREHLEDRPGNGKNGTDLPGVNLQSKGVREGL